MSEGPLIKLENVWKIYQLGKIELTVLKGINLEITPGAFMVILGPSGSGKSTLLHIIGLLDVPTKGKVFWKGRNTLQFSSDELAKIRGKNIGFVFQQFNLLPHLNALENVTMPMIFQGVSEEERKERAKFLLSLVGLKERIFHKPSELSGGEQQRVAIARALANNPDIIVADEPTGNLDSSTGKEIMKVLTNLHRGENKTIIVVTHDPHIASYSEKVVRIQDGQLILDKVMEKEILWENKK